MKLVFDIETTPIKEGDIGLSSIDLIHCIVAQDVDTEEIFIFEPWELEAGVSLLMKANTLIGHNIIVWGICKS